MVGDTKIMSSRNYAGTAVVARPHMEQLVARTRSGITARWQPGPDERAAALREIRARGWALTDEQLAPGIRSVAAPLRDGEGQVIAALNVTVHAAETPIEVLTGEYLPLLLQTAGAISADWAACQAAPSSSSPMAAVCPLSGRVDDRRPAGRGPQASALADGPPDPPRHDDAHHG